MDDSSGSRATAHRASFTTRQPIPVVTDADIAAAHDEMDERTRAAYERTCRAAMGSVQK